MTNPWRRPRSWRKRSSRPAREEVAEPEAEAVEPPKKPRRASRAKKVVAEDAVSEPVAAAEPEAPQPEASQPEAARPEPAAPTEAAAEDSPSRRKPASGEPAVAVVSSTPPEGETKPESDQPKRSGWWQRKSFF